MLAYMGKTKRSKRDKDMTAGITAIKMGCTLIFRLISFTLSS